MAGQGKLLLLTGKSLLKIIVTATKLKLLHNAHGTRMLPKYISRQILNFVRQRPGLAAMQQSVSAVKKVQINIK